MVFATPDAVFPSRVAVTQDFGVFTNDVDFMLTTPADSSASTFRVSDASGLAIGMWVPVRGVNGLEICQITAVQQSPPEITVDRGKDGTLAISHHQGEKSVAGVPAFFFNRVVKELISTQQQVFNIIGAGVLLIDGSNSLLNGLNLKGGTANIITVTGTPTAPRTILLPDRGGFLAVGETFNVKDYGAIGNGTTDDTAAINTAYTATKAANGTLLFPSGTYKVTSAHAFLLGSNTRIQGMMGSSILVPNTATLNDAVGDGFFSYNNGVFYYEGNGLTNVIFDNMTFTIQKNEICAFQVGVFTTTTAEQHDRIQVLGCKVSGGSYNIFNNCKLEMHKCKFADTNGGAVNAPRAYDAVITDNVFEYIGVDRARTVWNNAAAFEAVSSRGGTFSDNVIEVTGGTSVRISATTSQDLFAWTIANNTLIGCGLSAISVETRSFGTKTVADTAITGNVVKGYLCAAASGTDHSAINLGSLASGINSKNQVCTGNVVSFIAPFETFDEATSTVTASPNPFKLTTQDAGSSYGIRAALCRGLVISGNEFYGIPRNAIVVETSVSFRVSDNVSNFCGWGRDGTGTPFQVSASVFCDSCNDGTINDNTATNHALPTVDNEFTVPFRIRNPIAIGFFGNQFANHAGLVRHMLILTGGGSLTQNGLVDVASSVHVGDNMSAGHTYDGTQGSNTGLDFRYNIAGGSSDIIVTYTGHPFYNAAPGSRTLQPWHTLLAGTAGTGNTITLPKASLVKGRPMLLKNNNSAGNMTIDADAAELIDGATTYVLAAQEAITLAPDGVGWMVF